MRYRRAQRSSRGDNHGTAAVGALLSLLITLAFVGLASQTMLHLFASTVVAAAANDAASYVAAEGNRCGGSAGHAPVAAVIEARIGTMATDPSFTVTCSRGVEQARVAIGVDSPGRRAGILPMFVGLRVEQEATVRVEQWR